MGGKSKHQSEDQHTQQDYDDQEQFDIQEQVQNKIRQLPNIKDKIQVIALNNYLIQKRNLDSQLQNQTQLLEQNFRLKFAPFIEEMNQIINGEYNITDIDLEEAGQLLTQDDRSKISQHIDNKPIPEYWLKVFINSQVLGQQIEQVDEPILKHLYKVDAEKTADLKRLSINFYFTENQWFSNLKLTKNFDIEQTQIKKSYGDQINWKAGKNVTVKIIKKKGKKGGAKKTKQVKEKSFFNFFKDIEINSDDEDNQSQAQEDQAQDLEIQYEIAEAIYADLVPKSLQYYLDVVGDIEGEDFDDQDQILDNQKPKKSSKKGKSSEEDSDDE